MKITDKQEYFYIKNFKIFLINFAKMKILTLIQYFSNILSIKIEFLSKANKKNET